MSAHLEGKVIIVTGAGGGFGRLICAKAAAAGAKIVASDIDGAAVAETVEMITANNGAAMAVTSDVTDLASMKAMAAQALEAYGQIDVMVNNAGIMPLAFYSDHEEAASAWQRCIDINIKGVLHGAICVYDQMMAQGRGHVINISSIYGNFPVVGAGVYGASKAAVNFLSESLRVEAQGKIKVTIIKPTGVPATGLGSGVINPEAVVGILGQNAASYLDVLQNFGAGTLDAAAQNPDSPQNAVLDPNYIAQAVIDVIDQPWGVSLGDVTIRATGDGYIL